MKNKILSLILLIFYSSTLKAQTILYNSKVQTNVSYGKNISLVKFKKNRTTDLLTLYEDNTSYIQLINLDLYFSKHLGLSVNYRMNLSKTTNKRNDLFKNEINKSYSNIFDYSIYSNLEDGLFNTGNIGIIYRYENKKIIFQPKITLGSTGFTAYNASIYLKDKASNKYYEVNYLVNIKDNNFFTPGIGLNIGYKLHKKIIANFESTYSTFKPNISFNKEEKDLLLNTSKTEKFIYNNRQHNLSFGIGLTYVFKNKK